MSFATRDYKVRYAQTYMGYWWSLIQPLASVAVLYLIFSRMIGVETSDVSYLPFAMSGLILWNYFNFVISQSASALINAQNMIRKIYFPKICLPLSKAMVGLIAPGIGLLILIVLLFIEDHVNWIGLLYFIPAILFTAISSLGIGLWTSAISIRYRDVQQIIPYILQLLFFLTPIAYSSKLANNLIPSGYEFLIYLNPMSGIIELLRSGLFGMEISPNAWISFTISILSFLTGLRYFQKMEIKMADLI